MLGTEFIKYVVYRTPILRKTMAPRYKYKVSPGQIAALIDLIDKTREAGGAICEIGVAQGDTSTFILEHLKTTGDRRTVHFFDTFQGFTEQSIDHEVRVRGNSRSRLNVFRYGSEAIFQKNLAAAGYENFVTHKGDASEFDWRSLGPIGAVLLDIDLYQPTINVLNHIWPLMVEGGGIVIDDCLPDTAWDGSLQAYQEFITAHQLPFRRVGNKGGLVVKQSLSKP